MGIAVKFDSTDVRVMAKNLAISALQRTGDAVAVMMSEQTDRAFKNSGQPSRNWPPINPPKPSKRVAPGQVLRTSRDKPLVSTGMLAASFSVAEPIVNGKTVTVQQSSSSAVANMHQHGIHTDGPNYIPITRKGKLLHQNGANPKDEGLVAGVDYIIAWNGVDVPARPMIDFSDPVNRQEINDTISDITGG